MKYTVKMGSVVMIYLPNFIKINLGVQKFIWGRGHTESMVIA
jgi:hypothetical protein